MKHLGDRIPQHAPIAFADKVHAIIFYNIYRVQSVILTLFRSITPGTTTSSKEGVAISIFFSSYDFPKSI